jgi:D-gamma-glutamyl-meso-diaminopimelic acid endopeptidase CwlS
MAMSRVSVRFPVKPPVLRALAVLALGTGSLAAAEYTVKPGDSLYVIAKRNGVSVDQIRSWNGLKNDMIRPGQKLVIGEGGTAAPAPAPAQPAPVVPAPAGSAPAANLPGGAGMLTDKVVTDLAATPALSEFLYTVQEGDSLAVVAKRFGTSVKSIQWINDLGSDMIRIEQQLLVPTTKGDNGRGKLIASHAALPAEETVHTVAKGESLSSIAAAYQTSVTRLRWRNGLKTNALASGQQVIIPGQNVSNALPTPAPAPTPVPTPTPTPNPPVAAAPSEVIPDQIDAAAQESLARNGQYAEVIHTVKPGETVATVATAYGSSAAAIRWLNDLGQGELVVDKVILVPTLTDGEGLRLRNHDALPSGGPTGNEIPYVIVADDALAVVAMKYNTTLARLRWRNKLPSNAIRVGQNLVIVTTRPPGN